MEGLSKFITILPGGGSCQFITILQWEGGVSRDPKFVLRNIWTAPKNVHFSEFRVFLLFVMNRNNASQFVFLFADHSKDIFQVDLCHLILNPVSFAIFILLEIAQFHPL